MMGFRGARLAHYDDLPEWLRSAVWLEGIRVMDSADVSAKQLIRVLKSASHNGLIHRGALVRADIYQGCTGRTRLQGCQV